MSYTAVFYVESDKKYIYWLLGACPRLNLFMREKPDKSEQNRMDLSEYIKFLAIVNLLTD